MKPSKIRSSFFNSAAILLGPLSPYRAQRRGPTVETEPCLVCTTQLASVRFASSLWGHRAVRRDAAFGLEAILVTQPLRKRPRTDPDLCASEHGAQETDLGEEITLGTSPSLPLDDYLSFCHPKQAPLRWKVPDFDNSRRTQVVAPAAHSCVWLHSELLSWRREGSPSGSPYTR